MTLDEFKKQQKSSLRDFQKKASGSDRPQAIREARERLQTAKIIDKNNRLCRPYQ